jgi:6-phosphogluconate dehydrogenase
MAVFARALSAQKAARVEASKVLPGPAAVAQGTFGAGVQALLGDRKTFVEAVRRALYASKIISYAQGFVQLREASREHDWGLDYGECALLWRGGCIIRAQFLDRIKEAFDAQPNLTNLLLAPYFREAVAQSQASWRAVVAAATVAGIPVPAFGAALAYYDGYRRERLPANLLQAQRDYFGAHTYQRVDDDAALHTEWLERRRAPRD